MNNLKILADFHHASLLNSLIMLFEGRLGGEVYRPIGTEWFEQGFWKIYDHPATVNQYLGIGGATPDGSQPLNEVLTTTEVLGDPNGIRTTVYHCKDIEGNRTNKAITLEGFMNVPFDIVVASIPQHIEPFKRLCEMHPNHPKLIFQIGNAWTVEAGLAPNVMASAIIHNVPENINFISYHQEFDLLTFHPDLSTIPGQEINTFVNCFNTMDHFKADWNLFLEVESRMPGWSFGSFGGQCRNGVKNGSEELSDAMRNSRFIWHTKAGGDGFGHSIHNAAAVGRPLIVKKDYYLGKMAEPLLIDGITCICIDGLSIIEIIEKIHYFSEPERYKEMCKNAYENFIKVVDFDKEAELIKDFLAKLL